MQLFENQDYEVIEQTTNMLDDLNNLGEEYDNISEMSKQERSFIIELIQRNKPKKILELGVSKGGSSLLLLNAIKDIEDARLYSIDLNSLWYKDNHYKTGYYVDNYEYLKAKWKLYTGKLAYNFMDEIGSGVVFCLIDTVHLNAGEILDFLMVLPYFNDDAIVCFHDTNLHTKLTKNQFVQYEYTNNLLISAIYGTKYIQGNFVKVDNWTEFPNIAAVRLKPETKSHIFEIFNLLTLRWYVFPPKNEIEGLANFFEDKYGYKWKKYFLDVCEFQYKLSNINKRKMSYNDILKKIFSIKNSFNNTHKIITILGIKIKIKIN